MSKIDALRGQLRLVEERREPVRPARIGMIAVILLVLAAGVVGAAGLRVLPTYSADDAGSIMFNAG